MSTNLYPPYGPATSCKREYGILASFKYSNIEKSNLIIGGSGELNLKSYGEETTGIKVKKDLFIFDTTINIDVNDNGIKSGSTMGIYNANIFSTLDTHLS